MSPRPLGWDVIVPLKCVSLAKTRLTVLGDAWRERLARAMFLDTVEAVTQCPLPLRVHAVTDDGPTITELATLRTAQGPVVVHAHAPRGLNNAITHTATRVTEPGWATVALLGDLPSLSGRVLADVLAHTDPAPRQVVPDAENVGSTMLVVAAGRALLPSFGPGSFPRHLASGAVPIPAPHAARRDVDHPDDLWAASRLGTGPRTTAALHDLGRRSCEAIPLPSVMS